MAFDAGAGKGAEGSLQAVVDAAMQWRSAQLMTSGRWAPHELPLVDALEKYEDGVQEPRNIEIDQSSMRVFVVHAKEAGKSTPEAARVAAEMLMESMYSLGTSDYFRVTVEREDRPGTEDESR